MKRSKTVTNLVSQKTFISKFPKLTETFNLLGKRYSANKNIFLKNYNAGEWGKTVYEKKVLI